MTSPLWVPNARYWVLRCKHVNRNDNTSSQRASSRDCYQSAVGYRYRVCCSLDDSTVSRVQGYPCFRYIPRSDEGDCASTSRNQNVLRVDKLSRLDTTSECAKRTVGEAFSRSSNATVSRVCEDYVVRASTDECVYLQTILYGNTGSATKTLAPAS